MSSAGTHHTVSPTKFNCGIQVDYITLIYIYIFCLCICVSLCPIFAFVHRWCAEGGKLICCDYCNNAFCKKCILRNLGRKELSFITDENSKWHCYVCRSDPLQELVNKCHRIMEKLEQDQKAKQRKSEKLEESKRHKSKAVKEHKAVVNGKEHSEGSGTMTFSYKKLQVPKELVKKAKKLVETTTGLNHTFIQFIQQGAGEQGQGSIRYRHLKAFKAVLTDLQKAHTTLEEALEHEFKNVDVQNGNEEHLAVATTAAENDHMEDEEEENCGGGEADDGLPLEHDMDDEEADDNNEPDVNSDSASKDALDGKDSQSETDSPKKVVKTEPCDDGLLSAGETSLDQDIMSVPPSVPEELFQMVESLADSTMLAQADSNATADSEKDSESVKSNGEALDEEKPKPKVKNLIVKLTPVPVVTTSGKKSRSKSRDQGETPKKPKEEQDKEKNSSPPPTRRSSRVKTTPLRKQAEKKVCKDETSDSEMEQDGKAEKSSNRDEGQAMAEDSDSDEVPAILKEQAAEDQSTDNEQEQEKASAKKRLFKANNTPDGDKDSKRKRRKPESSDSDLESKTVKSSKKRKQKKSTEPSSSDSDQEKAAKGKASTAKRRSSNKKKEEDKTSPESRSVESKRSYKRKSKRRSSKPSSKLQSSSSSSSSSSQDEEEQQDDGGDSRDEHDVQKIKPIVEESVMGAGGAFRQSSGGFVCDLAVCSSTLISISLALYIHLYISPNQASSPLQSI